METSPQVSLLRKSSDYSGKHLIIFKNKVNHIGKDFFLMGKLIY